MAKKPNRRQASPDAPGQDRRGPVKDSGAPTVDVVRSEERLRVGSQVRVTGRAVLRKYLVTETVTQTFQIRHEEARLEHEPAASHEDSSDGDRRPFADGVAAEMVLHREVPRVVMDVVATERVRLHVETVTEQVSVSEVLRKEKVALEPPEPELPHRTRGG